MLYAQKQAKIRKNNFDFLLKTGYGPKAGFSLKGMGSHELIAENRSILLRAENDLPDRAQWFNDLSCAPGD